MYPTFRQEVELKIKSINSSKVIVDFDNMELSLVKDPQNKLYLKRVQRETDPNESDTESHDSTVLKRQVSRNRINWLTEHE